MKVVFITGSTGVIGSAVTRLFLTEADTRVRLLVRASSPEHLRQRLRTLFEFWGDDETSASMASRVEAFAGDVSRPRLGLDAATYERLTHEVTHVVHSAGNVRLNRPLDEARADAVDPALQIVTLVQACRQQGLPVKLDFVSTVGGAGNVPGVVPETPLDGVRLFRNTYEAAKAEAENLVLAEMGRGLAGTIHRPSMVVGDSRTGAVPQFQVFYHLCEFLSGRKTLG